MQKSIARRRWVVAAAGLVLVLVLLAWQRLGPGAFEIGGGTALQQPPVSLQIGRPALWQLDMLAWGEGAPVQAQMGQVRMEYRVLGVDPWVEAQLMPGFPLLVKPAAGKRLRYQFTLSAPPGSVGAQVEARFHVQMGGQQSLIAGSQIVRVLPAD